MKNMREHQEQTTFFDWVRRNREYALNLEVRKAMKLCYAVPNGAYYKDDYKRGLIMREEGLTPGVLDVSLDQPVFKNYVVTKNGTPMVQLQKSDIWPGLRIEFKYRKPPISKAIQEKIDTGAYLVDLSPEQKEMRKLLIGAGYKVSVVYSAAQAIREVFEYLPFDEKDYQGIKEFLC